MAENFEQHSFEFFVVMFSLTLTAEYGNFQLDHKCAQAKSEVCKCALHLRCALEVHV